MSWWLVGQWKDNLWVCGCSSVVGGKTVGESVIGGRTVDGKTVSW